MLRKLHLSYKPIPVGRRVFSAIALAVITYVVNGEERQSTLLAAHTFIAVGSHHFEANFCVSCIRAQSNSLFIFRDREPFCNSQRAFITRGFSLWPALPAPAQTGFIPLAVSRSALLQADIALPFTWWREMNRAATTPTLELTFFTP